MSHKIWIKNLTWTGQCSQIPPFTSPPALQFTPSSILFPNFRILSSCLFLYLNYSKLVYDILTYQKLRRKVDNLLYICPVKVCNKEGVNWGGGGFFGNIGKFCFNLTQISKFCDPTCAKWNRNLPSFIGTNNKEDEEKNNWKYFDRKQLIIGVKFTPKKRAEPPRI